MAKKKLKKLGQKVVDQPQVQIDGLMVPLNTKIDIRKKAQLKLIALEDKRPLSFYVQEAIDKLVEDRKVKSMSVQDAIDVLATKGGAV